MGWNTELTAASAAGDEATYFPDTSDVHGYTSAVFTAPKKGIYRFTLRGSGGHARHTFGEQAAGGVGGLTVGYMLLEAGQTVYVGCGGPCSAAWAATANPGNAGVSAIAQGSLLFVAGAGGGGGSTWGEDKNGFCGTGGAGGGSSGADGVSNNGKHGTGGTQSAGGTGYNHDSEPKNNGGYGIGSRAVYTNNQDDNGYGGAGTGGDGGDGYYGGGAGQSVGNERANGGGGGSGYVIAWAAAGMTVAGKTYYATTQQGGGAASNCAGSVAVAYHAAAELPVSFNGTRLTKLIFNGTEVASLIYNGTTVYIGRCRACLKRRAARFACLRAIRASLALRWRAYRWERMTSLSSPCASRMASS